MSSNKIVVILLACIIILCLSIAGLFLFQNSKKDSKTTSNNAPVNNLKPYFTDPMVYIKNTLEPSLYSGQDLVFRLQGVTTDESSIYKSPTWTKDGYNIYFQAFYTIKGEKYKENDLPLDYDIFVKAIVPSDISENQLKDMLLKIYPNSNLTSEPRTFIIKDEIKSTEVFNFNEDGSADLATAKQVVVQPNSEVSEYVWDNEDKTLETRAIWKIGTDGEKLTYYFFACRVFPESPLYSQRTCFVE